LCPNGSSKERAVLMSRMLRKTGEVLLEIVNRRHLAKVLSTHLTRFRFAQSALSSKERAVFQGRML
jgi:hypothetical protein